MRVNTTPVQQGQIFKEVAGQLLADGISALARKDLKMLTIILKTFHWLDMPEIKKNQAIR